MHFSHIIAKAIADERLREADAARRHRPPAATEDREPEPRRGRRRIGTAIRIALSAFR